MKLKEWAAFIALGLIWGSSFFWIKIALREIGPFTLVGFRLLAGGSLLLALIAIRRVALPRERRVWLMLILVAFTNIAAPFVLFSWGEQFTDSSVASIWNATVPLFTMLIAPLFLSDERITLNKTLGLLAGFAGVLLLVSRDLGQIGDRASLIGQTAMLMAAISYAGGSIFVRRNLQGVTPMVKAAVTVIIADVMLWTAVSAVETPVQVPKLPMTWLAVVWLGILGSAVAFLLYFYLIQTVGATRATMVTYLMPVVGVILGVRFLNERLDGALVVGMLFVVLGIVIVNSKRQLKLRRRPVTQGAAHD